MKKLVFILCLFLLYVTNPNLGKHQRAVQKNLYELVPETIVTDAAAYLLAKQITKRKDYYLFSLTIISKYGKETIIGIGLLTKVYIL
jgi:competence protein ComGC